LPNDITTDAARRWIDRLLSCVGIPNAQREDCVARGSVVLGEVVFLFLEPLYGQPGFIIVRALVGELPPEGQCERLYQMALEVQADFCGPYVPVLCLDWPSRTLMVSTQLDIAAMAPDVGAHVLVGLREMARQWRAAIDQHRAGGEAPAAGKQVATAR
jgi:hypothetical protein